MNHVLVIDDDPRLGDLLSQYLGARGFQVSLARSGPEGLERLARGDIELVTLDVMMPGMDGFDVLRSIRTNHAALPVIMLTAQGDETDRIVGLELGADDYLPKPFNPRELLARLRAVLRRSTSSQGSDDEVLELRGVQLNIQRRQVLKGQQCIELTTTEFEILRTLMARAGRVVPRERLMEEARGEEWAAFDRSIDVHISNLRRKLGDSTRPPQIIRTIRGVGYMIPT